MYLRHFRRQCGHSQIWSAGEPQARPYGRLLFWSCVILLVLRRQKCICAIFEGNVNIRGYGTRASHGLAATAGCYFGVVGLC